jgi:hypothetical protein
MAIFTLQLSNSRVEFFYSFKYNIYEDIWYIELNNIIYIVFGTICLIIYILLKSKSRSKNIIAKIRRGF